MDSLAEMLPALRWVACCCRCLSFPWVLSTGESRHATLQQMIDLLMEAFCDTFGVQ